MHSSRMRTPACWCIPGRGGYIQGGLPGGGGLHGGIWPGGFASRGICPPPPRFAGVVCIGGGSAQTPRFAWGLGRPPPPLWTESLTDRRKYITFRQLRLRAVISEQHDCIENSCKTLRRSYWELRYLSVPYGKQGVNTDGSSCVRSKISHSRHDELLT